MTGRKLLVPAYLLACLLLGGSTQSMWFNALLQLAAIGIMAWAAIVGLREPLPDSARRLFWLAAAMVLLVLLHLIPVPFGLWSALPGRGMVREGLAILGLAPGWQTLSLAPYDTIAAALLLLPPLAMLAGIFVLRAYTRSGIAIALLIGATLGLALGVLQVSSPEATQAQFYLQSEVNGGTPSGFFANPNHMATLLLITLPFLAALRGSGSEERARHKRHARLLLCGAGMTVVVIGILLNRSLAGLGLLLPVGVASVLMLVQPPAWATKAVAGAVALGLALFIVVLASPLNRALFQGDAVTSIATRREFLATSLAAAREYAPVGSGIGTFQRVYRIKEDPHSVDPTVYVNHAHDDYIELLVETGLPGAALILLFLAWWVSAVGAMLRSPTSDLYARAGAIASGAVLLHSLVDFPLRNSAISSSFAVSLALIVISRKRARGPQDLWRTRHLEIG
ncbi:MAG: O-antigen ligase family protein [Sphingomicrobium sp.]|nr:O-antigen ligase family protein [Sphingomonadales bacterium]